MERLNVAFKLLNPVPFDEMGRKWDANGMNWDRIAGLRATFGSPYRPSADFDLDHLCSLCNGPKLAAGSE